MICRHGVLEPHPAALRQPDTTAVAFAGELAGSFDELYSRLNPQAAMAARQAKVTRLEQPR